MRFENSVSDIFKYLIISLIRLFIALSIFLLFRICTNNQFGVIFYALNFDATQNGFIFASSKSVSQYRFPNIQKKFEKSILGDKS
jgi:hypothetical protein